MLKGSIGGAARTAVAILLPVGLASPAARAAFVYDNMHMASRYQPLLATQQLADDVTLAPGGRRVTNFNVIVLDNDHVGLTGDFTATFYLPDDKGLPGAVIWQGTSHVDNLVPHSIWQVAWTVPNVTVPDSFIWGLSINTTSKDIGPLLYDTPSIGSSQDVAYFNDGTGWSAYDSHAGGAPDLANFEARVSADVPEPMTPGLTAVTGVGLLATRRRRRSVA
jgi:hypothetical protein